MAAAGTIAAGRRSRRQRASRRTRRRAIRRGSRPLVLTLALGFFALFLVLPLVAVFVEALRKGWAVYLAALVEPDALSAIRLTLLTAAIAVPLNLVFGVAAAWAIAKFDFPRQAAADHLDRPAVLGVAGDRRPDLRAGVRRAGLVRPVAGRARHQDHLRRARHRAGHRVRDLPVRRARADPADAGAGPRRGGGRRSCSAPPAGRRSAR